MTTTPDASCSLPRVEPDRVDAAARALLASRAPIVLAVSGGRDSMVLLHAVHRALVARVRGKAAPSVSVVTFDHGTGPAAADAAALVAEQASARGLRVTVGRALAAGTSEAEWRAARWAFFRSVTPDGSVVVTAHTWDDHIETVAMRIIRGAGARGLAGLSAAAPGVRRPFLRIPCAAIARYAADHGVPFVEDPSNQSRRHFRNRVRLDLLPAMRALRPRFEAELATLAERAAGLRIDIDNFVARLLRVDAETGSIRVARDELSTYDSAALCVLWPAIAARAGVTLDRRGTLRLAQFTTAGTPGSRIQVAGGVEVYRHRDVSGDGFVFRRIAGYTRPDIRLPLTGVVDLGAWRFRPAPFPDMESAEQRTAERSDRSGVGSRVAWSAELPADCQLTVRAWRPGDRMRVATSGSARRVKRFFSDARIPGPMRAGWPVVLAGDEIVWIPGVRGLRVVPERSGRPVIRYTCERFDGGLAYNS